MSSNSLMQVEDRFRKTNHSSPEAQAKQTGRGLEPPVPSRSESFSNGNSESVHPALQRPAEPQVAGASSLAVLKTCRVAGSLCRVCSSLSVSLKGGQVDSWHGQEACVQLQGEEACGGLSVFLQDFY